MYQKFIKICISLLALLGGSHVTKDEDQFDIDIKDFLQEKYPETDLEELRSKIDSVEIKNIIKSTSTNKIPRFNLKLYAFVNDAMIDFPQSNFIYDTITTNNFFRNVHRLIKVKSIFYVMRTIFVTGMFVKINQKLLSLCIIYLALICFSLQKVTVQLHGVQKI